MKVLPSSLARTIVTILVVGLMLGYAPNVFADSSSVNNDNNRVFEIKVKNGKVTFNKCIGTCTATDIDPTATIATRPLRPWQLQKGIALTKVGIQVALSDARNKPTNFNAADHIVCLNYTTEMMKAAGGQGNIRVAYWDSGISNCHNETGKPCKAVKGQWHILNTTYDASNQACARLRLAASFALVTVKPGK